MKLKRLVQLLIIAVLFQSVSAVAAPAVTITGLQSTYGLGSSISVTYEVDDANGLLDISVVGAKSDIYIRVSRGKQGYNYKVKPEEKAAIPLNMGDGEYNVKVLLCIAGTKTEVLWSKSLYIQLKDDVMPFLNPSKIIHWTQEMDLVGKAEALMVEGDPRATALAICSFISEEYTYDYDKAKAMTVLDYVPDLVEIYKGDKGICYDLATLYAAMCRSVGIPAKLVMGYSPYTGMNIYHAWCLVKIDGEWLQVDLVYSINHGSVFLDASKTTEVKVY